MFLVSCFLEVLSGVICCVLVFLLSDAFLLLSRGVCVWCVCFLVVAVFCYVFFLVFLCSNFLVIFNAFSCFVIVVSFVFS